MCERTRSERFMKSWFWKYSSVDMYNSGDDHEFSNDYVLERQKYLYERKLLNGAMLIKCDVGGEIYLRQGFPCQKVSIERHFVYHRNHGDSDNKIIRKVYNVWGFVHFGGYDDLDR
ncbi:hypothetical protein LOAG_05720 [Loa loa]|uniref:Uncharacterized protein n=1 Tax=Loa loa TaxID=7209 RepID=A0A1S0TZF1_LOALO|nr:hypothetical protein LOAG_05720 [Loa loa]EFO22765.1 hypothetical protein LOAG_05720 [Loa loa]